MKTVTVRLPESLAAAIDSEARRRRISKSDVVRERLETGGSDRTSLLERVADLVGSVEALPADLSARKKHYLKARRYGRRRAR